MRLGILIEIDQDVPAEDHVERSKLRKVGATGSVDDMPPGEELGD